MTGKQNSKKHIKYLVKELIIAIVICAAISLVIQPVTVMGSSMQSTYEENDYLIINKLSYLNSDKIKHGDIIVFESNESGEDNGKRYIKRVIGVENDYIEISDGKVYVNDEVIDESYIKDGYTDGKFEKQCVPEDSVFVLGDNRLHSKDSRMIGFVPVESIVGKVVLQLYPLHDLGLIKY